MGVLYVLEDERGDLFLVSESTCEDSTSPVVLDDPKLWEAYCESSRAMIRARRTVLDALRVRATPETLTMKQIADVRKWASENGSKGLHADAVRCERPDPPTGAMRRLCAHLNRGIPL